MPRRTRRVFTPAFKAEVLRELLAGQRSHAELCREHQLSPSLLTLWKDTALEHLQLLFQERQERDPQQARIAELEQLHGRPPPVRRYRPENVPPKESCLHKQFRASKVVFTPASTLGGAAQDGPSGNGAGEGVSRVRPHSRECR